MREPNGPLQFQWCQSGTDPCNGGGVNQLQIVIPPANVTCNFQLDLAIGAPLETVGPHGSYYGARRAPAGDEPPGWERSTPAAPTCCSTLSTRGSATAPPSPASSIDKQWVGTGSVPPVNVPAGFELTVTSSTSATDATVLGTATCAVERRRLHLRLPRRGRSGDVPRAASS